MNRKTLIVEKALELFNEKGSRNVTTNHIVEALQLSPGNLYYYFKNKEAIIREIFVLMLQEWEADTYQIDSVLLSPEALEMMLQKTGIFFKKYTFIHKELPFLIENDEEFKKINTQIQTKRLTQLNNMIDFNIQKGVFRELTQGEKEFFVDILWMGSLFWHSYLEVSGQDGIEAKKGKILDHFKVLFDTYKKS